MTRSLWAAVGAVVLALASVPTAEGQVDSAGLAWDRHDLAAAERLYAARLAADSSDVRALHRMGLMLAWNGSHEESLGLLDRLLTLQPANRPARIDRVRVVAWSGNFPAALDALDAILEEFPTETGAMELRAQVAAWDRDFDDAIGTYNALLGIVTAHGDANRRVRLGLAQVLAWSQEFDSAAAIYSALVEENSTDLEALLGAARTEVWSGDLLTAEALWRRALDADSSSVSSRVGLSQTLRRQGRHPEAYDVIERAPVAGPRDADVEAERRALRSFFGPRVDPAFIFETDSDGNDIATVQLRARWSPRPRIGVRLDSYLRHARQEGPAPERTAQGMTASLTTYLVPGWVASGGVGVSGSDAPTEGATPNVFASVSTPRRYSIGASLAYAYGPFDATALLIERGVTLGEISLAARAEPSAGWTLSLGLARGSLTGTESNTRTVFKATVTRLLAPLWTLGGRLKAFGYERDINDGYFDPDLYWLLEVPLRWRRQLQRFAIVAEIAPGLQQVSDGSAKAALLAYSRVGYTLAQGRELGVGLTYSHSGASAFATDAADYRYFSINAGGTWIF